MEPRTLRNWGLAAGVAAMAGALGIATFTRDPGAAPEPERPTIAGALPKFSSPWPLADEPEPETPASAPAPELTFAAAEAGAAPNDPPATFLVRFEDAHPLARAQALAAEGRDAAAQRAAERGVRNDRNLRGLCFDRFTVGGAEIVLKPCAPVPPEERADFRQGWAERLSAMPGVAYAEANVIVRPETVRPQ
jgi:hypothetical protein